MCNKHKGFVARPLNVENNRLARVQLRKLGDPQVAAELVLLRDSNSDIAVRTGDAQVVGRRGADVAQDRRISEQIPEVFLVGRQKRALRLDHQRGPRLIKVPNSEGNHGGDDSGDRHDRHHLRPGQMFKVHRTRLYKEGNSMADDTEAGAS